ncbi:MAG: PIN domain-containing protein [Prevotella sp.]|jgi:predicted nucleic acid-binding protein|nr:PIN domain-containing protein [Prevotella sp.]
MDYNKFLIDTNIIIELLAKRESFYRDTQNLFTLADGAGTRFQFYISALSFANAQYILSKYLNQDEIRENLIKFKPFVRVLPLDDKILELALASDFSNFEDAIQYYTALEHELDIIVTRNKKDFKTSDLPVLSAGELWKLIVLR